MRPITVMASLSPAAAVNESWNEVVSATSRLMVKYVSELILDEHTPYRQLENLLIEYDLTDGTQVRILHDLRILRNKMVHAPEYGITSQQAAEYLSILMVSYKDTIHHVRHFRLDPESRGYSKL